MSRYAELAAACDRNLWEGMTRFLRRLPGMRETEHGQLRALDSGSALGRFNPAVVYGELRDPEAAARQLLDFYAGRPGRILISGRLQSGDALAAALRRAGCLERAARMPNMLLAIEDLAEGGPTPATHGVTLAEVTDAAGCDAWVETLTAGFELTLSRAEVRAVHAGLPAALAAGEMRLYLATLDGVPVGCCYVAESEGLVGIFGLATVPALRRRGIASELLRHVLDAAGARGVGWATLRGTPDSEPTYHRLGFVWTHELRELLTPPR